ncbi:sensor histidine kinase [Anaerovorax odorimutans]|uniref:sensor histidine kinase n=1 Tax=Anaerovorax odorimutans TaxID=109327 RepID=UPI00048866F5|nr:histidine kinase N-terminal 7TM domain-containing protein [Anaerovorax odorimutans]
MEEITQIKIATITLWNFAAIIVNVIVFAVLYMKANRNASLKAFFLVQLSMLIWLIGKVFKTVSPTADIRWAFIVFYYFGICLLEVSFLDFAYIYNKGKPLKKRIRIFIYVIALLQFIIIFTNPYHFLFYSEYSFWGDDFGILFYFHMAINYLFMIIGLLLCSNKFKKQLKDRGRLERNIIFVAILAPIILNFIYITRTLETLFNMLQIQIFDITPIVYTWSLLVFIYATFKYEFFNLTPIMKHEVTSKLDAFILIIDSIGRILYMNKYLKQNFRITNEYIKEKGILNKCKTYDKLNEEDKIIKNMDQYYKCNVSILKMFGNNKYIITFNDITSYQIAKNELYKENEDLENANEKLECQIEMLKQTSYIGARNYVARELHDIIGHSLVVTMKLLEVTKIFYCKNKNRAFESLEKAKISIKKGFQEMKELRDKDDEIIYNTSILQRELNSMLKVVEMSGIKANFYMRGKEEKLDEKTFDIIKKVSTELVTNTLKHAKASSLLLSIGIYDENISIQLMDNGIGINNLKKGNGLKGIDSRLELVGGKAKYISNKGEGFSCNMIIPK